MTNSKTQRNNTTLINSIFFFIVFFMFSFSGSAQATASLDLNFNEKEAPATVKLENSKANSNIEFALWFMGTKQDPNAAVSTEGESAKKMIITSGIAPNRLLLKAFLKKVVNYETSLS